MAEELQKRAKRRKLYSFKPNPKQKEFVELNQKIRLFLAGNQSGKSTIGVLEVISFCLGFRPYLLPADKDHKTLFKPPVKVRIFGEDFINHLGKVIVPLLKEWLPEQELARKPKKNQVGVPAFWEFKNGSTLELLSYEMESDKCEGWTGHMAWFDEPPPRAHFIATQRGLMKNDGCSLLTLTPLKEAWIYDELWLKRNTNRIGGITANTRDNVGFGLTEEGVRQFEEGLSEDEIAARIRGEFSFMSGLVYKDFNPKIHVIKPFDTKDLSLYEAIDPHPRTPHAVLWLGVDEKGTKYVVNELFQRCLIDELAEFIKIKRGGKEPVQTIIDPSAIIKDPVNNTSIKDRLLQCGIYTESGSKDLAGGIQRVSKAIKLIPDNDGNKRPELYIFNRCKRTIWEFQHYMWDEWKHPEQRTAKNRPKDKDDHMMENLRRILLKEPDYIKFGRSAEVWASPE